jgi:N-acetyl sugar amidotransferase
MTSFSYDVVLSLTPAPSLRERFPAIHEWTGGRRVLAATLNHRLFSLHDKNVMKGTIEAQDLDHLMFSIRPTVASVVASWSPDAIAQFKSLAQLAHVIQVMAYYDVPQAIVDGTSIGFPEATTARVSDVGPLLAEFIAEIRQRWPKGAALGKQLPWLLSTASSLEKVGARELFFTSGFASHAAAIVSYNDSQIADRDADLFWIGFDPAFPQVPSKPYPQTVWTTRAEHTPGGRALFERELQYCTRCCMPETMEGITFDELGVCVPCRSSEDKMRIDWSARRAQLERLVESYRASDYYDCLLPMSGGKDSMFQAHLLRRHLDVTPLAVTHGQNWLSLTGRYNLENCLQKFDLDHLMFTMRRSLINRVARKSLDAIGDACWHCHIGTGTFPVQTAVAWGLGLMCFGESLAEQDGRATYRDQPAASVFYNLEVSARRTAEQMSGDDIPLRDLSPWMYPSSDAIAATRIRYVHLGDYFFWDEERQVEFIKRTYDWMDAPVENAYKRYKSVECVMAGVHDYANFIKRGIGRATVQASEDVRRGLLTREEGFDLARAYDTQRPHALTYYLQIANLTEPEFEESLGRSRMTSAFARKLPV